MTELSQFSAGASDNPSSVVTRRATRAPVQPKSSRTRGEHHITERGVEFTAVARSSERPVTPPPKRTRDVRPRRSQNSYSQPLQDMRAFGDTQVTPPSKRRQPQTFVSPDVQRIQSAMARAREIADDNEDSLRAWYCMFVRRSLTTASSHAHAHRAALCGTYLYLQRAAQLACL